jgi:diguanylate cyclase (GGDEF)-like protein
VNKKQKKVVPLTTGKPRRDQITEVLEKMMGPKARLSKPITVMLLEIDDLDGFLKVFGAKRIERLLEEVVAVLRQSLRTSDIIASYGPDRFGLVLKGTGPRVAPQVGKRIRKAIREAAFAPEHGHVLKITVSGGYVVHSVRAPFESAEDLIKGAADCLREAREAGQDRILGSKPSSSTLDFPESETRN